MNGNHVNRDRAPSPAGLSRNSGGGGGKRKPWIPPRLDRSVGMLDDVRGAKAPITEPGKGNASYS